MERRQYHIDCCKGDVSRYVLLPGDPARISIISQIWDSVQEVAIHREYKTNTGVYKGVLISAVSTGIGSPSAGIAVEELARIGVDTMIRVGSCGTIQPNIECGSLVISTGAVRLEGTSKQYVRPEYPAVASYEIVLALMEAAELLGCNYHVGVTASTDSFYCGQGRVGFGGYNSSMTENLISDLQKARVLNLEMETATILTLASLFGLRAGSICTVFAVGQDKFEPRGEKEAAQVASEAVKILSDWDARKDITGKKYWYPSLR
ncbi:MAG: nucleoside phosphorylase [Methanocellales archaeon]|nr:nucleoside phosphorylase [Methanocellales archaeon]